jgi:hypothetical protein
MCAFDCFGKLCFSIKHFGKEALAMLVFGARCFFFLGFGGLRRSGKQMNETKTIS